MMTLARSKLFWGAVLLFFVIASTGVIDFPTSDSEHEYGPREPGINKQFNCRYMTVEVEAAWSEQQLNDGVRTIPARLTAQLGTAGPANDSILLVDQEIGIFKREFCAKPGSSLRADVFVSVLVNSVSCYFMSGPNTDADNETTAHGPPVPRNYKLGAAVQQAAWCIGVVP